MKVAPSEDPLSPCFPIKHRAAGASWLVGLCQATVCGLVHSLTPWRRWRDRRAVFSVYTAQNGRRILDQESA